MCVCLSVCINTHEHERGIDRQKKTLRPVSANSVQEMSMALADAMTRAQTDKP